jgi:hypothetical protein
MEGMEREKPGKGGFLLVINHQVGDGVRLPDLQTRTICGSKTSILFLREVGLSIIFWG